MRNHIGFTVTVTPRDAKEALVRSTLIGGKLQPSTSVSSFNQFSFLQYVESWSGKQISKWIGGLGDHMNPYLGMIRNDIRSGKHLELVDEDTLMKIGISGVGPRKIILQAIQLLLHFCHEVPNENLQTLAMNVVVACRNVAREMFNALHMRENAMRRSEIVTILNNVTSAVSSTAEQTKKLIFWLDRSPFDEIVTYIEKRNKIAHLIWNLVRNVNVQPKALFETAAEIVKIADDLEDECRAIIESEDSLILCTSYVESAVLKRPDHSTNWGINLQSSFRGVHVVSEIKVGSPADSCSKIDAGDEIMMINGKVVIGWDLTSVAQRIASSGDSELKLMLNKRPRETTPLLMKPTPKTSARPLAKLPGSQATADDGSIFVNVGYPLIRRRSLILMSEIINMNEQRNRSLRRSRRASIASTSVDNRTVDTNAVDASEPWDLLELIAPPKPVEDPTRIVKRARTMRHQPDGYVRSFIDNKLVHEIEDDVVADQLPFNVKCPTEFAEIAVVEPHELQQLNLVEPKITDDEWKAPFQEFATQSYRAPMGDSNISALSIESPRFPTPSNKMTSSMDDFSPCGVLPSPSTSSMNSVSSPAPFKSMSTSITEWPSRKFFEGWVRRRKTGAELKEVTNKWPKCWMCLKGPYLLLCQNQHTRRADISINLAKASISENTDLKTSKRFVFRVSSPTTDYHFSCYNALDLKSWVQKINFAKAVFSETQQRVMSQSVSYTTDADLGMADPSHYNTMNGLPSMMSQSHHESMSPTKPKSLTPGPTSSISQSLTRPLHLSTSILPGSASSKFPSFSKSKKI
ncbi:unnamed protein product [Caenorhabditis auriculariae]|uniref:Uncharacterized protein n=1 Tax=Caenorhabditis auriculariae TaxID=2777116 RepID=A0A8S1H419_9PELO|nr:unnamed protein product [Caenorhabditis auriculariae]